MVEDKPQQSDDAGGGPEAGPGRSDQQMIDAEISAFDARLGDAARVLGDATEMTGSPQDRAAFFEGLRGLIAITAHAEQAAEGNTQAQGVQGTIDAFGRATGRALSNDQRALLEQGINALAQINASQQNRHDLALIKSNISLFLDNLAQVTGKVFSVYERRLLTRALLRLVGDGPQNPGPA